MEQAAPLDGHVRAEVIRDGDGFTALAAEWDALYRAAPRATPFQAHAWLDAWWRAYGGRRPLRVAVVRDGEGRLVAAAPLHLRRRGPVRVLAPLGGAISDFTDVLVAEDLLTPEQVPGVVAALRTALEAAGGWDVVDLPEARPGAAAELLLDGWHGPRWSLPASTCMEVHAGSFEELLAQFPSKRASEVRRRLRRADALGIEMVDVPPEEVAEGVAEMIRLHAEQWEGRGVNPEHLRPRFAQHLTEALGRMIRDGQAVLSRFRLDGEVVGVKLALVGHDMTGGYLVGVRPAVYKKMDFFPFLLRDDLRITARAGLSVLSMLRGREEHKDRWKPVPRVSRRLVLGRTAAAYPYAAAVLLRARAVGVAKRRAPWVRSLPQRIAAVRATVAGGPRSADQASPEDRAAAARRAG
ncbi:GNAT family N-acetyltransferase [Geodermatophilus sp. URMC 64]